ncbi:MAG: DUF1800 domain-containing protein [Gemmatimonadales bacterium]
MNTRIRVVWIAACLGLSGQQLQAQDPVDPRSDALHLLNRISFGPRPGDVDRVLAVGWEAYLTQQLRPDELADPAMVTLQREFRILDASPSEFAALDRRARQERRRMQEQARRSDTPSREMMRSPATLERRSLFAEVPQLAFARAVTSERQLYEVMVDFWTNHFNVFARKGLVGSYLHDYVETTIRLHALGRFEDLLRATAQHPAMLLYLDNAQSITPGATSPELERLERRAEKMESSRADSLRAAIEARLPTGINENYARELLELHTLGVDGGYTQADIQNVARILTGWAVAQPARGGDFSFNAWAHDYESKEVMGHTYPAGHGLGEGLDLLRWLARHPSTRHHVSAKLCMRFVSDAAPDGCIDAAVRAWRRSDGNIADVVAAIVRSPDFWSKTHRVAKTKTPFEFFAGAVRALDGFVTSEPGSVRILERLGQPLYQESAPTGYPEVQSAWVNSGALLTRMNIALALASGRAQGIDVDLERVIPLDRDYARMVTQANLRLLNGTASPNTLDVLLREAHDTRSPMEARTLIVSLALGSPEFQRQ